jgi:hypothetical protein
MAAANIRLELEKRIDSNPRSRDFHNGAECMPMVRRNHPVDVD